MAHIASKNLSSEELEQYFDLPMVISPSKPGFVTRGPEFTYGGKTFPVKVANAGAKGVGVFATRNIKRGEICCFYDGILHRGMSACLFISGVAGYIQQIGSSPAYPSGNKIAGFTKQLRPGGCAQLCNDYSTTYTDSMENGRKCNVSELVTPDKAFVFVATKRIKKGEELLYCYGAEYWEDKAVRLEKMGHIDDESSVKLIEFGDDEMKESVLQAIHKLYPDCDPKDLHEHVVLNPIKEDGLMDYLMRYQIVSQMIQTQNS